MKKHIYLLCIGTILGGCVAESTYNEVVEQQNILKMKVDSLNSKIDHLKYVVEVLNEKNSILSDSIHRLSFPADQRYLEIVTLVKNGDFDFALKRISELKNVFPKSLEVTKLPEQEQIIARKKAAIKAEEERRKALGFKVFKDQSLITVRHNNGDIVKCSFSSFGFDRIFSFDYINDVDEYYYRDADKNNTYILADLTLTTKASSAYPPSVYACSIVDGKLKVISWFDSEYASWETYGAYIGNYSESSHDFSKVNTVRFKLGAEISLEEAKCPIVIVMFKNNVSNNKRIEGMTVEDVNQYCDVIRIINRNKI